MKEVIYNYDNLKENEIDEVVVRVKAIIIDDNDVISLGYCNKTYQLPGGHIEYNEDLFDGLIREVKEETGIDISNSEIKPFQKISHFSKNYRNSGKNRKNDIYYYYIKTNDKFDVNKTSFDERETEYGYTVKEFPLGEIEEVLLNSVNDNINNKVIVEEMLDVIKEFKKIR